MSRRSPRRCAGCANGPRIIISRRSPRCCAWCCPRRRRSTGRARSPNIARPASVPERLTPQREQALERIGGRQGTVRELADHRRRQRRRDPRAGQDRRDRGGRGRRRPAARPPRSGPRSARAERRPARGRGEPRARQSARASTRCCSTASPARARPRSISKRSPRRSRQGARRSSCCPRSRSPSRSSSASTRASAARRWPGIRTCAQSQRRRAWRAIASGEARVMVGARSALFLPYPKLGLIVVDEAHETSFKQEDGVQYHARDVAVMRAQVRGYPGRARLGDAGDREPPHGRDRPLPRGEAARPLRRRRAARHRAIDLTQDPPPRGRWLAPPLVARARGESRARASRRCCSSTAAAMRRSPYAAIAATASNAPIAPPGWSSTG